MMQDKGSMTLEN